MCYCAVAIYIHATYYEDHNFLFALCSPRIVYLFHIFFVHEVQKKDLKIYMNIKCTRLFSYSSLH